MREAGRMVADVLALMAEMVAPGVSTGDLNEAAHARMIELGAERPSFLDYVVGGKPYPAAICASIDDEIVHGIPGRCVHRGCERGGNDAVDRHSHDCDTARVRRLIPRAAETRGGGRRLPLLLDALLHMGFHARECTEAGFLAARGRSCAPLP